MFIKPVIKGNYFIYIDQINVSLLGERFCRLLIVESLIY